jgi:protein-tyrosine phosphatase
MIAHRNKKELLMRKVERRALWIGNSSDLRDAQIVMATGVEAVIELSASEQLAVLPRELIRCRFPLCDGEENPEWLLRFASETVATFLRVGVAVLVCCSAGMSRSVVVAAGGIALAENRPLVDSLTIVAGSGPADVLPALFMQLKQALESTS